MGNCLGCVLAESRLKYQGLQRGRPGSDQELGLLVGKVRRRLSLVAVKAQVDCLLAKLHQVGPGNIQLAKKRAHPGRPEDGKGEGCTVVEAGGRGAHP